MKWDSDYLVDDTGRVLGFIDHPAFFRGMTAELLHPARSKVGYFIDRESAKRALEEAAKANAR